jgi:hypothetical protein
MQDYTLSEVHQIKQALEQKIRLGLTDLLNAFAEETGMSVHKLTVDFIDVSTIQQIQYIPSKVNVYIIGDGLSFTSLGEYEENK